MTEITQAAREAMAKRFERADMGRLHFPPKPDYGEMHHEDILYDHELKVIAAIIRGSMTAAQ